VSYLLVVVVEWAEGEDEDCSSEPRASTYADFFPAILLVWGSRSSECDTHSFYALLLGSYCAMDSMQQNDSDFEVEKSEVEGWLAKVMSRINFAKLAHGVHHTRPSLYIPPGLYTATHVWRRVDSFTLPGGTVWRSIWSARTTTKDVPHPLAFDGNSGCANPQWSHLPIRPCNKKKNK